MKRALAAISMIVVVAFLLIPSQSMGQLGKGLKGGINSANFAGDDAQDTKTLSGFAAGGFLRIALGPLPLSIQPEVLFTQKGAKSSDVEDGEVIDLEWRITYVEIPVLARISIGGGPGIKPNLFAGPAFAFLLSSKLKGTIAGNTQELDYKEFTKDVDMGAVVGVGLEIGAGTLAVSLEARYTLGMKSIDSSADELDLKNGVLSILGGVSF